MNKQSKKDTICTRGVWDTSIPGIAFDSNGVSNYAKMFDQICKIYPRGAQGEREWNQIVEKMKREGRGKRYDCIIGVSGGTDSSYLLHIMNKNYKLRPLAVNVDNGWNSEIAVDNIKKLTQALDIDLETYVIDYEEVKIVLRAYIKASLPWIDSPSDIAIKSALYIIAAREGIKYTINGGDFRSEGKQPTEWTYSDTRQLQYLVSSFEGKHKLTSFPSNTITDLLYYSVVRGIKTYRPYYYIDYQKKKAQEILQSEYGWRYYGGHHHENVFTKFAITYWLPKKFCIDKRIITLSAQILSGEITRQQALDQLSQPSFDEKLIGRDKKYILKKLELSEDEFETCFLGENKFYYDYPSYFSIYQKYSKWTQKVFRKILPFKPTIFIEQDYRQSKQML